MEYATEQIEDQMEYAAEQIEYATEETGKGMRIAAEYTGDLTEHVGATVGNSVVKLGEGVGANVVNMGETIGTVAEGVADGDFVKAGYGLSDGIVKGQEIGTNNLVHIYNCNPSNVLKDKLIEDVQV